MKYTTSNEVLGRLSFNSRLTFHNCFNQSYARDHRLQINIDMRFILIRDTWYVWKALYYLAWVLYAYTYIYIAIIFDSFYSFQLHSSLELAPITLILLTVIWVLQLLSYPVCPPVSFNGPVTLLNPI